MIPQLFKTKLTAGVIAVTFCSAGVAAAATGGLPGPLQRGLDRAAAVVGHDVPPTTASADGRNGTGEDDDTTTTSGSTTSTTSSSSTTSGSTTSTSTGDSSTTEATSATSDGTTSSTDAMDDEDADHEEKDTPVGPDATGPAKKGLCNAYMHSVAQGHSKNADAVAFRNLTKAATDAGQTVEEFCDDDTPVDTGSTSTSASSMPSSSSSMPSDDDDDDGEMTSTSAKTRGSSATAAGHAKHGKP